ncbi:uncharacterized protein PHACADRAFT_265504 [Phanerochaete carnosa HHB-10118-sp]|uniref:SUN domain-containing protein n=1 Tax=Phanerochaete carnosa (strain HHB-10118-sp) TaxID=650164 RepID=K5VST1_PHACS|nr:uncharacterized protein PHACADRAFT_265504 [Phanerochaete carnosa HHB-10118-sp]EKM49800.1 hypothetical protein PHACADRAFT_265504 [Phanerochaete carnosa HHB-10118-sp]
MRSLRILPVPLLALLFALPVLSESTTPNDPFRHVLVQAEKGTESPVCCLRPLTPLEDTEEEVVLSFEEWKAKRVTGLAKDRPAVLAPQSSKSVSSPGVADAIPETPPAVDQAGAGVGPSAVPLDQAEVPVPDAPYFKIPTTDRFNYASSDCSARVHAAQNSAKSASSILSSKKDRYMLSPCTEKNQFVVVELCDDIRIDTVQLANYEFFSGVFKDFSVYVAKTYDAEAWTFAGTYRAKNIRGVQTFHPPTTLSDFYRFIRLEFHSHYGNEYYCPLSLLRVYGLTHLEHWKWEQWEAESRTRRALEIVPVTQPEIVVDSVPTLSVSWTDLPEPPKHYDAIIPNEVTSTSEEESATSMSVQSASEYVAREPTPETVITSSQMASAHVIPAGHVVSGPDTFAPPSTQNAAPSDIVSEAIPDANNDDSRHLNTDASLYTTITSSEARLPSSVSLLDSASALSHSLSSLSSHLLQSGSSQSLSSVSTTNQSAQAVRSSTTSTTLSTGVQSVTIVPHAPAPAPATGGESIYRTIMNRLIALESNSSLYARFVEDHAASVREMLRRLSEDVGRLEGIGKAQAQMYERSVHQFERQQRRLEAEHNELLSRVSRLTEEVILEKRLGIAQLCLLLAVLVFMAFTRGSRSEPLPGPAGAAGRVHSRTPSVVGWGQRTLNIGGDWVNKLRHRSLSPSSSIAQTEIPAKLSLDMNDLTVGIDFPSQGVQAGDTFPRSKRAHPITGGHRRVGSTGRSRTPQSARAFRHSSPSHPATPMTTSSVAAIPRIDPRPQIQRVHSSAMSQSFSMGVIGPVPKSARRWARTAHLHEVKSSVPLGTSGSEGGRSRQPSVSGDGDEGVRPGPVHSQSEATFGSSARPPMSQAAQSAFELERPTGGTGLGLAELDEGDGWVDTDAESDAEHIRS